MKAEMIRLRSMVSRNSVISMCGLYGEMRLNYFGFHHFALLISQATYVAKKKFHKWPSALTHESIFNVIIINYNQHLHFSYMYFWLWFSVCGNFFTSHNSHQSDMMFDRWLLLFCIDYWHAEYVCSEFISKLFSPVDPLSSNKVNCMLCDVNSEGIKSRYFI